jgi:hypothetical protein
MVRGFASGRYNLRVTHTPPATAVSLATDEEVAAPFGLTTATAAGPAVGDRASGHPRGGGARWPSRAPDRLQASSGYHGAQA